MNITEESLHQSGYIKVLLNMLNSITHEEKNSIKLTMVSTKPLIFITITSLSAIAAVYSSSTFVAFGYISKVSCHYLTISHDHIGCCHQASDDTSNTVTVIRNYCYECIFSLDHGWRCGQSTEQTKGGESGNPTGPKAPPPVVTTEPPTVTPPNGSSPTTPENIEQSPSNVAPPSTSQPICSDGSAPDAKGNCPPVTQSPKETPSTDQGTTQTDDNKPSVKDREKVPKGGDILVPQTDQGVK